MKNNRQFDGKWLNENDALQQAYVRANGHVINNDPCQYFTITESAEQELIKATNELHLMYLHATDKVLKTTAYSRFSTSQKSSGRVCASPGQWRRHHMITGRMDFCMDERGIKVYEYNADSASCHTEGGLILEEWVKNGYRGTGHNPAEGLLEELTGAWKHSHARPFVHIMQDNDIEEDYHALFIQRSLIQPGLKPKSCMDWAR
ncbi:glutathionylspermidine synthase family protein [Enterobacter hormaechei]